MLKAPDRRRGHDADRPDRSFRLRRGPEGRRFETLSEIPSKKSADARDQDTPTQGEAFEGAAPKGRPSKMTIDERLERIEQMLAVRGKRLKLQKR